MKHSEYKPPRIVLAFFRWYCHPDLCEEIEGDLVEQFNYDLKQYGYTKAKWHIIKEVFFLFRPSVLGNMYHLTTYSVMATTKQKKRLFSILTVATSILLIPLIAMTINKEVQWKLFDFLIAGVLLIGFGILLEIILRKVRAVRYRILFGTLLIVILTLICVELAVGLFGTAIAGS